MDFGLGALIIVFLLLVVVSYGWTLLDILNSTMSGMAKLIWFVFALTNPGLGMMAWIAFGPNSLKS